MTVTIETSQAPDAKPVGVSRTLDSFWQVLISVPQYSVPEQIFGGTRYVVPGAAEIITPLLLANTSSALSFVSVRVYRKETNNYYTLLNNFPVYPNDLISVPLNGHVLITDELLEVICDRDNTVDAHISYTVGQPEQDDVVG